MIVHSGHFYMYNVYTFWYSEGNIYTKPLQEKQVNVITLLLIPQYLVSPGHPQPRYHQCRILVFHDSDFQLPAASKCRVKVKNTNIILFFSTQLISYQHFHWEGKTESNGFLIDIISGIPLSNHRAVFY